MYLLIVGLTACNPLDVSITEELSLDQIKSSSEGDSLFKPTYKIIKMFKSANKDDELVLSKYSNITYQDVVDYQKVLDNTQSWEVKFKEYEKKWNDKYSNCTDLGLAYIDSWGKALVSYNRLNDPKNFVRIDLVGVQTDYYSSISGIKNAYYKFKITPLKGRVEQVIWNVNPTAKINGRIEKTQSLRILNSDRYIYSRPFSRSVYGSYEVGYSNESKVGGESHQTLLRDYFLNMEIEKVRVNGQNYQLDDFEMPTDVKFYMKEIQEGDSVMADFYLSEIIRENIDSGYQSLTNFQLKQKEKYLKDKYLLIWEMHKEVFEEILDPDSKDYLQKLKDIFS